MDMGEPDSLKVIRSVSSDSVTGYKLTVISDTGERSEADIADGACSVKLNIKGKNFDFVISSESEHAEISSPYLTVDIYGGGL